MRFAGVDLGATSIDVEVTNGRLEPVAAYSEPADIRSGPKVILRRVGELLAKAKADGAFTKLDGVGIGVPGPVSFRDGVPVSPPIMPGWDRYPVREQLTREYGCPAVVDNDVNIMAIGERNGGVAHSVDNFLFVKVGTGIGCGVFLNGEVYRGTNGCAGDIGHIQADANGPACTCGNIGCLEAVFSGAALAREANAAARSGTSPALAERLAQHGEVTARDVAVGAVEGDVVCMQLIRDGGRRIGAVLAGMVSFVNPSMIVIGGGLAHLGHILLAEIRSVVYRRSLPLATGNLPLVLSELGPRAGVAGAAVLASEIAFEQA
jgi:glucokinase-like ROK family protein